MEPSLFEEASPKRANKIGNRQSIALFSNYLQELFALREGCEKMFIFGVLGVKGPDPKSFPPLDYQKVKCTKCACSKECLFLFSFE